MTDVQPTSPAPTDAEVSPIELAARLAARLCHDFISPTSALVSGLDLIEDPASQDMRAEAMDLITASGRKLEAFLTFYRIAFGGSSATELFDARELEKLARGRYAYTRAELDWAVEPAGLDKAPARALTDRAVDQVANVATLPGIVGAAYAMPDIHWGYGFPIGGVAATDVDAGGWSPPAASASTSAAASGCSAPG